MIDKKVTKILSILVVIVFKTWYLTCEERNKPHLIDFSNVSVCTVSRDNNH
ncbi:hypothetical protein FD44_GL000953 [Secundilactobacillus malefermentans DSM 5705 = KCTC 3548]|nr:hypothetical protein FD44_GL000953 [Secundilactobacillus malefermentans DSM 5705 = KCTC 3548]